MSAVPTALLVVSSFIGNWAAINAVRDADEQSKLARRPFVVPRVKEVTLGHYRSFYSFYANVILDDFGQTPAFKMRTDASILLDQRHVELWFHRMDIVGIPSTASMTTVGPNLETSKVNGAESVPMPYAQAKQLEDTGGSIFVVGRTTYEDIDGRAYQTDFCFQRLGNGAVRSCPSHNEST